LISTFLFFHTYLLVRARASFAISPRTRHRAARTIARTAAAQNRAPDARTHAAFCASTRGTRRGHWLLHRLLRTLRVRCAPCVAAPATRFAPAAPAMVLG